MLKIALANAYILVYSLRRCETVSSIRPMTLPYLDLTYCIEGQMEYLINNTPVTLKAGDAILFPPGSTRYRKETNIPSYYASFNIMFHDKVTFPIEGKIENSVHADTILMLETISRIFRSASDLKNEKCLSLFLFLYNQLIETSTNKDSTYIKIVKQYISEHIDEKITMNMLAQIVHLTPQYLCNVFKNETGMTVFHFIIEQRIDMAKRIIISHQQLTIPQIAEKCGFCDVNYFSNTFKKRVGLSPTQYKKITLTDLMR